ncbi:MAG: NAD-dependent epimerase/dehydratase family protein [Actinobacteria bacterium]|nr:NAD-dependent epimerase/dehydratase family protein [Actinomycetota bacterium]
MKAFVTGSTGFIGGNIVRKLLGSGFEVNVLVRKNSNTLNINKLPVKVFYGDICDRDSLKNIMKGCKVLFHAAALYSFWSSNPEIFYEINVRGTKNIIDAACDQGVEKIIYTSSESTINLNRENEDDDNFEEEFGTFSDINETSSVFGDYKKSKVLAELEVIKMIKEKVPVIIINPTTPIGPCDVKPTPTGKIVMDFLNKKMPAYVNTGLNIIDVEDVALGHILAFQKGKVGKRYILGNKNLTLFQIFEILEKITKIKAPKREIPLWLVKSFAYVSEFVSDKMFNKQPLLPVAAVKTAYKYRFFDCSSYIKELGINLTPVENSFEKAVKWFKENGYVRN